jgi:hypothetical protein
VNQFFNEVFVAAPPAVAMEFDLFREDVVNPEAGLRLLIAPHLD